MGMLKKLISLFLVCFLAFEIPCSSLYAHGIPSHPPHIFLTPFGNPEDNPNCAWHGGLTARTWQCRNLLVQKNAQYTNRFILLIRRCVDFVWYSSFVMLRSSWCCRMNAKTKSVDGPPSPCVEEKKVAATPPSNQASLTPAPRTSPRASA